MKYCIFSLETGIIRAVFDTPERDIDKQVLMHGEAVYRGDANPLLHRIAERDGLMQPVNCVDEDLRDGSVWSTQEGRRLSHADQSARRARIIQMQLRLLESDTVEIEGEKINLQRSLLEYVSATPGSQLEADALSRLQKLQARKDELRAQLSAGTDTSAP